MTTNDCPAGHWEGDPEEVMRTSKGDTTYHDGVNWQQRAEHAEAERDRLRDVLLSRHGGEPLALIDELDEARAERDRLKDENERLRSTLIAVYRSPLLDESAYHTRGEDIPQDVWDVCEAIRNAVQRDWKPREEAPHA